MVILPDALRGHVAFRLSAVPLPHHSIAPIPVLDRFSYRLYRLVTAVRHRAMRRFTHAGLLVLVGLAFTGAMSANPDQSVAYQAFALLLSLLIASFLGSLIFRQRLDTRRDLPRFGSVGEPMPYRIILHNLADRPEQNLEVIEELADPRPSFDEYRESLQAVRAAGSFRVASSPSHRRARTTDLVVPPLAPRQRVEVRATLTPLRRGPLRFESLIVARPDPFGLCRALRRMRLRQTVLVLPRRYRLPPFELPGTMKYQQGGVTLATSVGESEECIALRDYRRGDPLRRIHWRSWAHTGRPIVKEYQDEFFVRHALVLDTFAPPGNGAAFEEAVSLAASLACAIQTQESLLDLMFVGPQAFCFTSGRGLAHTEQMLEILASVRTCHEKPFSRLTDLVVEHASVLSGCLCVLVGWDAPRQELVRMLRALDVPLRVFLILPAGGQPPRDLGPMADVPESFFCLETGRIEEGLRRLAPVRSTAAAAQQRG